MARRNYTEEKIASMLTEGTGRHFLDSGGAYGRQWEKNQTAVAASGMSAVSFFRRQSAVSFNVHRWTANDGKAYSDIEVSLNLFHWLSGRLTYSPEWNRRFHKWARATDERAEDSWLENMRDFAAEYGERDSVYGENSCNGENLLAGTVQYQCFTSKETAGRWRGARWIDGRFSELVCLLQIHGGCDVRGGYTSPVAFTMEEEYSLAYDSDASIACCPPAPDPRQQPLPGYEPGYPTSHRWYSDGGYRWRCDEGLPMLRDYPCYAIGEDEPDASTPWQQLRKDEPAIWYEPGEGYGESRIAYCPECGSPLEAYTY